ncbi:MAG: hypothetical protein ACI39N_03920 [Lachnospiraceae bacterium]
MIFRKKTFCHKMGILIFLILSVQMLVACGQEKHAEMKENEAEESISIGSDEIETVSLFGENCIAEQTFEVELSEYNGTVYFVPFTPSKEKPEFYVQIMQDGEVLTNIHAYIPEKLKGETFTSLDAVSFFDVNYDDYTDIVMIQTYGTTSFAAIYYGFAKDADEYERYFSCQLNFSDNITEQVKNLTIPEIRNFVTQGKKNGEFVDYREAYEARSRLCALESNGEMQYNLIYFDKDEIPELVADVNGYYVSLYTYSNGRLYTLMDAWGYGAMGNAGYEYSPGKNSLRNFNTDFAGAILYTTYMAAGDRHSLDMVAQIVTYNFDDANKNGMPDEEEEASLGNYSVSYIDGKEVSDKECEAYDMSGYEYIEGTMNPEELKAKLNG